ncbi:ribbon-helix-helix domain-containing protein [Vibrio lentus]
MKSARTSVSLPCDQHQALQKLAEENGLSVSWVIRQAVGEFLSKHQEFKPLSNPQSKLEEEMDE